MNKRIILTILASIIFLVAPRPVEAHPIDITDSYFYIENELDGAELASNEVISYTYVNWFQAGMLVEEAENIVIADIDKLLEYQNLYESYVSEHLNVFNNDDQCTKTVLEAPIVRDEIIQSLGTRVIIQHTCGADLANLKISNTMFVDAFDKVQNYIYVNRGETELAMEILNRSDTEYDIPNVEEFIASLSSTGSTNTQKFLQPRQRNASDDGFLSKLISSLYLQSDSIKDASIIATIGLVFLMGFLHTLEAGHSKAVLASAMVSHSMDVKRGLVYSGVFTLTHLADIVILGVILLIANNFINVYEKFSMLQIFAGYAFLVIAVYMLFRNLSSYLKHRAEHAAGIEHDHNHDHDHDHVHVSPDASFREQITIGFLTGLAPCLFGWSIFMLVLSTRNLWVLFPLMISFGLGIFIALALVVFLISRLRGAAYKRFSFISEVSPIISALFLVIYGLFLIF